MPSDEEAQISTPPHTPPHPAAPAATAPAPAAVAATSAPPPRTSTPTLASHHPSTEPPSHSHPSCPSCGEVPGEYVSLAEYRRTMSIVRLQVSVPISILVSLGTMLICGAVIDPGLRGINVLYPTLLTPNGMLLSVYWGAVYAIQVGFCLLLIFAQSDDTKDTFVHGVGMKIAVSNWLIAGWAVCWTLRMFKTAEICVFINVITVVWMNITLLKYPASIMHPLRAIFIHGTTSLLLAILFNLTWAHNGFVALKWVIKDEDLLHKWTWQAVGCVLGTNLISVFWEIGARQYLLAVANEYLLFTLLFASVRITPSLPESALPKPVPLLVTIIVCLVLHPIALVGGNAYAIHQGRREGQIRLPDDDEEDRQREAEIEAEVQARINARARERQQGHTQH